MLETGFYFFDGTDYHRFPAILESLGQFTQMPIKADEMVIRVDQDSPKPPFVEVIYVVDGTHIFHGIITKIDSRDNYVLLSCKSMQFLLDYRVIPYNIYHDVDLNTIFSSGVPTTVMGVWFLINSYIPNGKWAYHSATVSKLLNGGLKSCFGSKALYASTSYPNAGSIDGCDGVVELTDAGAVPTSDDAYYRTVDDLYVRFGDGSYRENAYIVAALNWCETRIRLKSIDIGTYKSEADFSMDGQASAEIDDFVEKLGREIEFLPWHDGSIKFIVALELPGRSSESSPVRTYIDGENDARVQFSNSDIPDFQAAISFGQSFTEAPQVVSDWSVLGIPLIKGYENQGSTKEDVLQTLQAIIDNNELSCTVETTKIDPYMRPGDWVGVYREDKGYFCLRVKEKTITPGLMTLSLGKKITSASTTFGEYLRGTIDDDANPRTITNISGGSGSFIVSAETAALGAVKIYYKENFNITAGTVVDSRAFLTLKVNGAIVGTGRIKLDAPTISIDITDYCTIPGTNTVLREMYLETGWTAATSRVEQYIPVKFFEP